MFNAQRYDVMPDGWTIMENGRRRPGTQREYQHEINRFKELLVDTYQGHSKMREIHIDDNGPPRMIPASRGFHA
eukprot:2908578-Karenia_brevis.AAC.1